VADEKAKLCARVSQGAGHMMAYEPGGACQKYLHF